MRTILTMTVTFDHEMDKEELHHEGEQIFKYLEVKYPNYDFLLRAEVSHQEELTHG